MIRSKNISYPTTIGLYERWSGANQGRCNAYFCIHNNIKNSIFEWILFLTLYVYINKIKKRCEGELYKHNTYM